MLQLCVHHKGIVIGTLRVQCSANIYYVAIHILTVIICIATYIFTVLPYNYSTHVYHLILSGILKKVLLWQLQSI